MTESIMIARPMDVVEKDGRYRHARFSRKGSRIKARVTIMVECSESADVQFAYPAELIMGKYQAFQ